jgi:phenylpropionate dioxygenase-like ring-hydroxylating dioxygenase large terminal subunit
LTTVLSEKREVQGILDRAEKAVNEGRVPLDIFTSQAIFDLEVEKLWSRVWTFIGHETEIPKPGDYIVRNIGPYDSIILTRDSDGVIRAFNNICAHRGMRICRADLGNTSHFRCPYHGWTYNDKGKLVGVPYRSSAYGDYPVLDKYKEGLRMVRVESYDGMLFGNLNEKAEPLREFLGDFTWYLDMMTKRTEGGLEFYPPLRHVSNFNWKIGAENFGTDSYHFKTTHRWILAVGLFPTDYEFAGVQASTNGHGISCITADPATAPAPMTYPVFWPEIVGMAEKRLKPDQFATLRTVMTFHGNVFPHLSFLNTSQGKTTFLTFRTWTPIAPDKTEFMAWFCVEKEAPEAFKRKSYDDYTQQHSLAGAVEVDDIEIWKYITRNSKSIAGRKIELNYDVGINSRKPVKGWLGPGTTAGIPNEMVALEIWRKLIQYLRD